MKYKVGDKVVVRKDLIKEQNYSMSGENYRSEEFVGDMLKFRGQIVTIWFADGCYYIREDFQNWCWTDEMFEGLYRPNIKIDIGALL